MEGNVDKGHSGQQCEPKLWQYENLKHVPPQIVTCYWSKLGNENRQQECPNNYAEKDPHYFVVISDLRGEKNVAEKDKAHLSCKSYIIQAKSQALIINSITEDIHDNILAPEATPVDHQAVNGKSAFDPLYEMVSNHRVVATQFEIQLTFVPRIPFVANLLVIPQVEAILCEKTCIGEKVKLVDKVTG